MRRTTFLATFLALFGMGQVNAQTIVYDVNENFESGTVASAFNFGLSGNFGTNSYCQNASTVQVSGITYGKVLDTYAGSVTSSHEGSKDLGTITPGSDGRLWIDFDWQVNNNNNPLYDGGNGGYVYFRDASGNLILGFNIEKGQGDAGNNLHVLNLDNTVSETSDPTNAATRIIPTNATGTFPRKYSWAHIHACLNFTTKTIDSLKIFNSTGAIYENNTLAFHNINASGTIKTFGMRFHRVGSNASYWRPQFDNFKIYHTSYNTATVTVNYLDVNGNPTGKAARVDAGQEIGNTYSVLESDKAAFTADGFYFAYDATATANNGGDNAVVANGGSTINLRFKKTAITSGTYSWTGLTSANWNDLDNNFSTDGTNSLSYQAENALLFPESASNKAISVINSFNLGSQNLEVTGSGYSFSGNTVLSGTGTFKINPGAGNKTTMNLTNQLSGGVSVLSGAAEILNNNAANSITMADGTKLILNTGTDFSKAITGAGTISLKIDAEKIYSSTITGIAALNVELGVPGTLSVSNWTTQMKLAIPTKTPVNITTSLDSAGYSINDAAGANAIFNLGENVRLLRFYNSSNTNTPIGALSGTTSSYLLGGFTAAITNYSIGGSNTNAVFNGTIKNFRTDAADILNIKKVGTGTWTLTAAHKGFTNGSVQVNGGKMIITGSIGTALMPFTVSGSSVLTAADTAKIVTSTLTMGATDSLKIAPKAVVTVNTAAGTSLSNVVIEINADTCGVLHLPADVISGTKLIVKELATPATSPKTYKLINSPAGVTFTEVVLPSALYTYNQITGELVYDITTGLHTAKAFEVYPTLVKQEMTVNGNDISAISIISLTGQVVKEAATISTNNRMNVSNLQNGAYFVKVRFNDGSINTQKIIVQK